MANAKQRPFKKLYCDRPEVFLLPATAFKVWMYHYIREGQTRESWPSLQTICEALNMSSKTVKKARKYLLDNGWLKKTGTRDRNSGEFKVPVMMVTRGTNPSPEGNKYPTVKSKSPRVKSSLWSRGKKFPPVAGKILPPEVESLLQVNTERQVEASPEPKLLSKTFETSEAGAMDRVTLPEGKKFPMVDSFPGLTWERGYGWCASRELGRGTSVEEVAEMKRRNALHLTPADFTAAA